MNREIQILETFAADQLRPGILDLISELKVQLEGAKLNRRKCLIAKTAGNIVVYIIYIVISVWTLFNLGPSTGLLSGVLSMFGIAMGSACVVICFMDWIDTIYSYFDKGFIRKDKVKLLRQLEAYQSIRQDWLDKIEEFQLLKTSLQELMDECRTVDDEQNIITNWLSLGQFQDIQVQIDNIKPGDHIYRRYKGKSRIVYHHGVYLGQIEGVGKVIDFGAVNREHPVTTSIEEFLGQLRSGDRIYRRDYKGFDIPVEKTIELAQTILSDQNWERYRVLGNNCEHFATFLKLQFICLTQVDGARSIVMDIMNGAGRTQRAIQVGVEVAEGNIFTWSKLTSLVKLAPIVTAVDIGMLVKDFNTTHPNIENITKALEFAEKEVRDCDLTVKQLKRLRSYMY